MNRFVSIRKIHATTLQITKEELLDAVVTNMASLDNLGSKQQIASRTSSLGRKWCHLLCKPLASHREIDPRSFLFGCICSFINPSRTQPLVDEGTEVEAAYKKLLVTFNQFNFERLGFETKAGEADEG